MAIAARAVGHSHSRVSMSAILAGVFVALVTQMLLVMLGLGIGIVALDIPATMGGADTGLTWATFGWWAVSGIIASFAGGLVAGWGLLDTDNARGLHGLVSWAIATVIVVGASVLAAGQTASIMSNMAGPMMGQTTRMGEMARQMMQPGTTGAAQQTAEQNRPQIEAAQNAMATAMLGGFVALLLGGLAGFLGGRAAPRGYAHRYDDEDLEMRGDSSRPVR